MGPTVSRTSAAATRRSLSRRPAPHRISESASGFPTTSASAGTRAVAVASTSAAGGGAACAASLAPSPPGLGPPDAPTSAGACSCSAAIVCTSDSRNSGSPVKDTPGEVTAVAKAARRVTRSGETAAERRAGESSREGRTVIWWMGDRGCPAPTAARVEPPDANLLLVRAARSSAAWVRKVPSCSAISLRKAARAARRYGSRSLESFSRRSKAWRGRR